MKVYGIKGAVVAEFKGKEAAAEARKAFHAARAHLKNGQTISLFSVSETGALSTLVEVHQPHLFSMEEVFPN